MGKILWIIIFIYAGMALLMWVMGLIVWLLRRNAFLRAFEVMVAIRNMIGLYAVCSIIGANLIYLVAGTHEDIGSDGSRWLYFGMGMLDITGIYLAGLWFLLTGVRRNLERETQAGTA
ncbi:MAG: hypothetical protein C4534_02965 [Gaiellales bacterium]|nr:MAG: hypothetical protein C4534_02965 [Gaiellales bacterium]